MTINQKNQQLQTLWGGLMKMKSILRNDIYDSEIRYRRLFESSKDGILILDAETGKIEDVNPFLMDLLGYSKKEFVEKSIWEIGTFHDIFENKEKFHELQLKEYVRYSDLPLVTSEGRKIHVEFVSNVYLVNSNKVIQCSIRDITEQKGKEDSLAKTHRATSDFLNILLNLMQAPIIIWDTSMIVIRFNRQFELLSGYNSADIIGKKIDFLFPEEKIASTLEMLKNHLDDKLEVAEIDILTKDNNIKTVLWNSSRILDEEGKNIIATISQDITIRRQSELALRKSESHFRTLVRTIPDLIWLKDANGMYLSCNQMFERFFGAKETDIIGKTDYDFVDRELADFFRGNDRKAMEAGKPTSNEEWVSFADDGHQAFLDTIKTPIYDPDGTLLGVLGMGRDITERKLAGQVLQASEKRFRAIFDQAPIAIAMIDLHGHPIAANLRLSEMLGYTKDELSKMMFTEFSYPEDTDKDLNQFTDLIAGKISGYNMEKRYIHKNGNLIWANLYVTTLNDNNGLPQEIIGMVEDITERKKAIAAIQESEERYRNVIDVSPDAIIVQSEGKIVLTNKAAVKAVGASGPNDLLGKSALEYVYPADREMAISRITDLLQTGKPAPLFEERMVKMNGSIIDVEVAAVRTIYNGKPASLVVIRDISDRKLTAKALQESNERFKALHNASFGGIAIHDKGIILECNQGLSDMTGYSLDELNGMDGLLLIAPEHREMVMNNIVTGYEKSYEANGLRKNGAKFPIRLEARNIPYKGKSARTVEFRDLTESKQAEEALRKSEAIKNKIVSNISDVVVIIDHNGINQYKSPGITKLFGWNPDELVGKSTWDLVHPGDLNYALQIFHSLLEDRNNSANFELRYRCKDDSYKWIEFTGVNLIHDKDINGILGNYHDITERKKTNIELVESKEKAEENKKMFKAIADTSPMAIYISKGIRQVAEYINPSFRKLFGYENEELSEAALWWPLAYPDKEYREQVTEQWNNNVAKAIQNKSGIEPMEVIVTCKDGTKKNILWGFVSTGNENWTFGMDLTSYRTTEQELIAAKEKAEESEEKYRAMYNNAPLSYQSLDENGNFIDINPMWSKTLGYERDEVIGKWYGDFLHPDYVEHFRKNFPAFKKRGYVSDVQFKLRRKDNTFIYVSFEGCIGYTPEGKFKQSYCVFKDITEQKALENAIIKAKEKAEESDRLKSAFLANMSHEIRTPMNGILGFTELLLEPDLDSEQKEVYIDIVKQSGQRMLNTVNDIVEISKIEAGIVSVNLKEVDVQLNLDELIRFFAPEATKKGLKLALENEIPKTIAVISTDKNKLDSILTNLIKNAIKYTPAGEIWVGCTVSENMLEFYIKDTGIGIPPERQQAIFDRFIQADIEDALAFQGSGLGLSIAKAYVEMLGGKIWVESQPGTGSTFHFNLPWEASTQKIIVYESAETEMPFAQSAAKPKILIAEDDDVSFHFLSIMMRNYSREILHATNGEQAVEICKHQPDIDIIFMDIKMPVLDGFDATRLIREFNKEVVIIAQTAYALSGDSEKALEAGCNDYISKPINKKDLLNKMGNLK